MAPVYQNLFCEKWDTALASRHVTYKTSKLKLLFFSLSLGSMVNHLPNPITDHFGMKDVVDGKSLTKPNNGSFWNERCRWSYLLNLLVDNLTLKTLNIYINT